MAKTIKEGWILEPSTGKYTAFNPYTGKTMRVGTSVASSRSAFKWATNEQKNKIERSATKSEKQKARELAKLPKVTQPAKKTKAGKERKQQYRKYKRTKKYTKKGGATYKGYSLSEIMDKLSEKYPHFMENLKELVDKAKKYGFEVGSLQAVGYKNYRYDRDDLDSALTNLRDQIVNESDNTATAVDTDIDINKASADQLINMIDNIMKELGWTAEDVLKARKKKR